MYTNSELHKGFLWVAVANGTHQFMFVHDKYRSGSSCDHFNFSNYDRGEPSN